MRTKRPLTEVIRDRDGNPIVRSANLAGIRRYVSGWNSPIIKRIGLGRIGEKGWEGKMLIIFENGASYETNFADFGVMTEFVRRWKNVYGAPLAVDGVDCGVVGPRNEAL